MDRDKDWEAFWDSNPEPQNVHNPMQLAQRVQTSPMMAASVASPRPMAAVTRSKPISYEHNHTSELHSLLDPPRKGRKTRLSDREKHDHSLSSVIMFLVGIVGLAGYMLWMIGTAT